MNIEKQLKKDGIIATEKVDTETVLNITNSISQKIVSTFPSFNLNPDEIFSKLFTLNMYKATMPEGMQEASYCYKNSSIYFNSHISNEDLEEFAIHECLHFLQEIKDDNNHLKRMGLAIYSKSKSIGTGLNEACVQYIASKIIGIKPDFEKYYNINLYTPSPSYYPLECSLLNELVFFIGEDKLFQSTYFSTDDFKNEIINRTSENTYKSIIHTFDEILKLEEKIIILNNKKNSSKTQLKIEKLRESIKCSYIKLQNLIIKEFFDFDFEQINNLEELEIYRRKLTNFDKYIGHIENYSFFDDYQAEMMNKLEHKSNILENGGTETALSTNISTIFSIIKKLKSILHLGVEKK